MISTSVDSAPLQVREREERGVGGHELVLQREPDDLGPVGVGGAARVLGQESARLGAPPERADEALPLLARGQLDRHLPRHALPSRPGLEPQRQLARLGVAPHEADDPAPAGRLLGVEPPDLGQVPLRVAEPHPAQRGLPPHLARSLGELGHHAEAAARFAGIRAEARLDDWPALVAQKDELVADLRRAKYVDLLSAYDGIAYRDGPARLAPDGVYVNGGLIRAQRTIVATGASPAGPSIPGIEAIDAAGLGAIVGALAILRNAGGDLAIARVPDALRSLLLITRLLDVLPPHDTVEAACHALSTPRKASTPPKASMRAPQTPEPRRSP